MCVIWYTEARFLYDRHLSCCVRLFCSFSFLTCRLLGSRVDKVLFSSHRPDTFPLYTLVTATTLSVYHLCAINTEVFPRLSRWCWWASFFWYPAFSVTLSSDGLNRKTNHPLKIPSDSQRPTSRARAENQELIPCIQNDHSEIGERSPAFIKVKSSGSYWLRCS